MHNAAHTMMISDIATSAWLINFFNKALYPWEVFQEILWQLSGSRWKILEVGQGNGEWFIPKIISI